MPDFLNERKKDLLIATIIPATDSAFRQFVQENRKSLWVREHGKVRQILSYLYPEMALTDRNGNELIRIVNGEAAPKAKRVNVSKPANTTYKTEEYFAGAKALHRGEVYVSHVTGWYVNRPDFEKGKRFSGIVRFSTPVFDQQGFAGVLTLALDYRHLAGFTDHIVPTQAGHVFEAGYASTGNYAYLVDNRGFVISHPYDYHIAGLRPDGTPVPALTDKNSEEMARRGEAVLNLNLLGYMDPNLPEIARDAAAGNTGLKMYKFGRPYEVRGLCAREVLFQGVSATGRFRMGRHGAGCGKVQRTGHQDVPEDRERGEILDDDHHRDPDPVRHPALPHPGASWPGASPAPSKRRSRRRRRKRQSSMTMTRTTSNA